MPINFNEMMEASRELIESVGFWYSNGFELIEIPIPMPIVENHFVMPNEVKRTNSKSPLSNKVICILNKFHLQYSLEQWENYNEICDFNEKMKDLF